MLGVKVAASTVWEILREAGVDPAPQRTSDNWATFLRTQAEAILAADFFEVATLSGTRIHVLAVIEHASRRVRVLSATAHPTTAWVTQAVRNLAMDLDDAGCTAQYFIRDRDGKFPALFDAILADAGIRVVLSGVRMPRMNSIMERCIQSCHHELLDRTLIWNQRHLLRALHEYERHHNVHRPHRGISNARPLRPLPDPITDPDTVTRLDDLGALTPARTGVPSPSVDLDETDAAENFELPGADLSGEELTVPVVPMQADEFRCVRCFLVHHRGQLADRRDSQKICRECS